MLRVPGDTPRWLEGTVRAFLAPRRHRLMKKFLLAALLALPLTALAQAPASAGDCCCCSSPTICCNFGFKFKCWGCCSCCCDDCCKPCCGSPCGGCGGCCAPWYSYWPYDAHFQTPAPTGYPYWPAGQAPMMYGSPPCAYGAPNYGNPAMAYGAPMYGNPAMAYGANSYGPPAPPMALPAPPPTVQPCGYTPSSAPSYWYGR